MWLAALLPAALLTAALFASAAAAQKEPPVPVPPLSSDARFQPKKIGAVQIGKAEVGIYCQPILTAARPEGAQLVFSKFQYAKGKLTFLVYSEHGHNWRDGRLRMFTYNGDGVRLKTLSLTGTATIGAGESVRVALAAKEQTAVRALVIVVPYDYPR
jgi:hypothetical protein